MSSKHSWYSSPELWQKLKPLARQMRKEPTAAEHKLWQRIRGKQVLGYKFRRQHAFERFIVDFYCSETRLIVEVDGPTHEYTPDEDAIRQKFLEGLGFKVIRFTNLEVLKQMEAVLNEIARVLGQPRHQEKGDDEAENFEDFIEHVRLLV